MLDRDWLYYRVYPERLPDIQPMLANAVPELVALAAELDPTMRWFFLRYVDHTGPHLRLRVRSGLDALAVLHERARVLLAPLARDVVVSLYEPEYAKYDGQVGVDLAERVFQRSSEAAVRLATGRAADAYRRDRLGYGLASIELATRWLPPARRRTFLYQYAWYWAGGRSGPLRDSVRRSATAHGAAVLAGARALLDVPPVAAELNAGVDLIRETSARARAARLRTSGWYLLFHHLHLQNNRLGVTPVEEALLAEVLYRAVADEAPPVRAVPVAGVPERSST
jgi:thiopeptide-type bacteriocin biosynthesis protein